MRPHRLAALLILFLAAACSRPEVVYENGVFEARGWKGPAPKEGWEKVFVVYAGEDDGRPSMAGQYTRRGSTIVFKPSHPPDPRVPLMAIYSPPNGAVQVRMINSRTARRAIAGPLVEAIYPSADALPENLLKFYIHFSRPMARGQAWDQLKLLDEQGQPIELPFVELDEELWDPAGRRLTVLFSPGRIKRGVGPNMTEGPPLVAGGRYTLVIGEGFKDAEGAPLSVTVRKAFAVTPAERRPMALSDWSLTPPAAGTRQSLVVEFTRPLDRALLAHTISVLRDGSTVTGEVAVGDDERRWTFTPQRPWRAGDYTLRVESLLEDLAGNRIGRAFDVDLAGKSPAPERPFYTREFQIR